jgi:alpha-1,6-mannosyltransferase
VPVIGFYHSDTRRVLRALLGLRAGRLIDRYVKRLYNQFDLVLAPSQSMCEELREIGVRRVVEQALGVDTAIFHPARRDPYLRARLGLPHETRLLIFAGRANREKNVDLLVETISKLGDSYHLLLVGHGLERYARKNITCYPYQRNSADLSPLLASSDALLHAGRQETFGLVAVEAMASGIPVVGPDTGPVAELVNEDTGVLVDQATSGAFAAGIASLYLKDPRRLGRNARRRAERHWNIDALMKDLVARYGLLAAA